MSGRSRYEVEFTDAALRALARLKRGDSTAAKRVALKVEDLKSNPRPPGAMALKGRPGQMRVRVGTYRIIYTVQDQRLIIIVLDVGHRSSIYE